MATIIITLILNLLVGTPSEGSKENKNDKTKPDSEIRTNGGSGTWTNTDKQP
jgi:hypothetical protein